MSTARQVRPCRRQVRAWPVVVLLLVAACARKYPKETGDAPSDAGAPSPSARAVASVARPATPEATPVAIPVATRDACRSICERSEQLKCKNAGHCAANCIGMAALTPCSQPISAMFSCFLREPLAHWACAEDGVAAIREGYCDAEQAQAVACMEAKMNP